MRHVRDELQLLDGQPSCQPCRDEDHRHADAEQQEYAEPDEQVSPPHLGHRGLQRAGAVQDPHLPDARRAVLGWAVLPPRTQADKPVGEWNTFEITVRGNTVEVVLNGVAVIPGADIPGLPPSGRIGLQHHGYKKDGQWAQSPSLLQFKNIFIKELPR